MAGIQSKKRLSKLTLLAVMGLLAVLGVVYVLATRAATPLLVMRHGTKFRPAAVYHLDSDPCKDQKAVCHATGRAVNEEPLPNDGLFGQQEETRLVWESGKGLAWYGPWWDEVTSLGDTGEALAYEACYYIKDIIGQGRSVFRLGVYRDGAEVRSATNDEAGTNLTVLAADQTGYRPYCLSYQLPQGVNPNMEWRIEVLSGRIRIDQVTASKVRLPRG